MAKKSAYSGMLARDKRVHRVKIEHDFFPTPAIATHALMKREKFVGPISEPACGTGEMSEVIKLYKPSVISTDLIDRGYGQGGIDFLNGRLPNFHNIVTNPPYRLANQFAERAMGLAQEKVCLLVRLLWLESQKRYVFFEKFPPARVWVFSERLKFWPKGFEKPITSVAYAWFVWEIGYSGDTILKWIAPEGK